VPARPLTISVCHSKGGVGKTTTTLVLARFLARNHRVALKDYDDTRQLSDLVRTLAGDGVLTRRLWLDREGAEPPAPRLVPEIVLIDAEPARGPRTWQALQEADLVLIPAPPEGLAVRAMRQMFQTLDLVRRQGNPTLHILGVIPTMVDRRWREHRAFLEEMARACREAGVYLFPPVVRRQSYLFLSTHGQDYRPVAEAVESALHGHVRALVGARSA
jgi:cellulose biosynthesis protein BcsQ